MNNQTIFMRREWEQQVLHCSEKEAFAIAQDLMRSGDYEAAAIAYSVLENVYEKRESECLRGLAGAHKAMGNLESAAIFFAMLEDSSLLETAGFVPDWWNGA